MKGRRSRLCRAVADKSVWKDIELVREIELVVFWSKLLQQTNWSKKKGSHRVKIWGFWHMIMEESVLQLHTWKSASCSWNEDLHPFRSLHTCLFFSHSYHTGNINSVHLRIFLYPGERTSELESELLAFCVWPLHQSSGLCPCSWKLGFANTLRISAFLFAPLIQFQCDSWKHEKEDARNAEPIWGNLSSNMEKDLHR